MVYELPIRCKTAHTFILHCIRARTYITNWLANLRLSSEITVGTYLMRKYYSTKYKSEHFRSRLLFHFWLYYKYEILKEFFLVARNFILSDNIIDFYLAPHSHNSFFVDIVLHFNSLYPCGIISKVYSFVAILCVQLIKNYKVT